MSLDADTENVLESLSGDQPEERSSDAAEELVSMQMSAGATAGAITKAIAFKLEQLGWDPEKDLDTPRDRLVQDTLEVVGIVFVEMNHDAVNRSTVTDHLAILETVEQHLRELKEKAEVVRAAISGATAEQQRRIRPLLWQLLKSGAAGIDTIRSHAAAFLA